MRTKPQLPSYKFSDISLEFLDSERHEPAFVMSNAPDSARTLCLVDDLFEQAKEISYQGQDPCSSKFGNRNAFSGGVLSAVDGVSALGG